MVPEKNDMDFLWWCRFESRVCSLEHIVEMDWTGYVSVMIPTKKISLNQHSINTQKSATVQYICIKIPYSTSFNHWGHMDLIFNQLGNKKNWTLHQNWWAEIFQRQLAFRFSPKEFTWNSHEHPVAFSHRSEICPQIQNNVFGPHNVCV